VILEPFYLPCLAHASYLVGDETTGAAAVVDPQRDVARYLEVAATRCGSTTAAAPVVSSPTRYDACARHGR